MVRLRLCQPTRGSSRAIWAGLRRRALLHQAEHRLRPESLIAGLDLSNRGAPSNLIGANGFAGQDHCSRVCGAKHRRAAGAPLTVILPGKRIGGTVGRATRTDWASAVPETA